MIAGIAPYPTPVRDWNAGKAGLVLSGDDDALAAACEADRVASVTLTGEPWRLLEIIGDLAKRARRAR